MTNERIALAMDEIATLLALQGENDFKCRAYQMAARSINEYPGEVASLVAAGRLASLRGVGEALREKIITLVKTGELPYLTELRSQVPPGLLDMLRLPGLGTKKVRLLHTSLSISTLLELKTACLAGKVASIKGFGARMQERILSGITFLETLGQQVRIDVAEVPGLLWVEWVRTLPDVFAVELAGSLRRRAETIDEITLVAACTEADAVLDACTQHASVQEVVERGGSSISLRIQIEIEGQTIGLPLTVIVASREQFPAVLAYHTGNAGHVEELGERASNQGLTFNEAGLTGPGTTGGWSSEEDIYDALELTWIPPELREHAGEFDASDERTIPELIKVTDLRGVFHNHTTASDGTASLADMARAAQVLGFQYLGIADHSQSLTIANGLSPDRVRHQWAAIDALNQQLEGFRIFKGTEVDILQDGSLDFPNELLAGFDYVVASVHTHFAMSREEMTARVCKAIAHPAVTMLGHPTGRLLLRRESFKIDLDRVLATAREHNTMIEINAQPSRLDLDWIHVRKARDLGIPIVINPDAHSMPELNLTRFGVDVARRGWLRAEDVFNTRDQETVAAELARRKAAWQ